MKPIKLIFLLTPFLGVNCLASSLESAPDVPFIVLESPARLVKMASNSKSCPVVKIGLAILLKESATEEARQKVLRFFDRSFEQTIRDFKHVCSNVREDRDSLKRNIRLAISKTVPADSILDIKFTEYTY